MPNAICLAICTCVSCPLRMCRLTTSFSTSQHQQHSLLEWLFVCSTGLYVACLSDGWMLTHLQTFDLYDSALSSWPSAESTPSHTLGAVDIVEKDDAFLIVADTPGENTTSLSPCLHVTDTACRHDELGRQGGCERLIHHSVGRAQGGAPRGERRQEELPSRAQLRTVQPLLPSASQHRCICHQGRVSSCLLMPCSCSLQASCENGVLKVTLPKVKPATPKGSSIAIADKHHA